jgi:CRISPR/Cas system-associated exonuclease Cas4 (RecB family)
MGFCRCPLVYRFSELGLPEYPSRPPGAGGGGADLGNYVHEALRQADFHASSAEETARLLRAAPGPVPEGAAEMIEWALSSPVAGEIRAAGHHVHREVPFYVPLQGASGPASVLHGIVDLVFRDMAGAWHVVDWKTNSIHDERRLATLTAQYRPQIQLYAAALATIYHTVGSGRLVFLGPREIVPIPVTRRDLDEALDAARAAVRKIGAGDYRARAGPKCAECGYRRGKWCDVGRGYASEISA